jgi:hypothetical protein
MTHIANRMKCTLMRYPKGHDGTSGDLDAADEHELLNLRPSGRSVDRVADQEEPETDSDTKSDDQRRPSGLRGWSIIYLASSPPLHSNAGWDS